MTDTEAALQRLERVARSWKSQGFSVVTHELQTALKDEQPLEAVKLMIKKYRLQGFETVSDELEDAL